MLRDSDLDAAGEQRPVNSNVVTIENLHKCYRLGNESIPALCGVSLGVEPGRFVAIMGPSGCGKTTLLNLMGGLDTSATGG